MLGIVFSQLVTVAHACTIAFSSSHPPVASAQEADATMAPDCAAMAKRTTANANVCASHCTYGQQIDVYADAPVAAIAPQPALTVSVMQSIVGPSLDTVFLHARSTAPPVSVLFSRFLI